MRLSGNRMKNHSLFFTVLFLMLARVSGQAQTAFPQDYFRSPLDIPIVLAGTFGELRSGHFHAGIDIAAPAGRAVLAVRKGEVAQTGFEGRYGNYVLLRHELDETWPQCLLERPLVLYEILSIFQ